jgi:hypothetical protein
VLDNNKFISEDIRRIEEQTKKQLDDMISEKPEDGANIAGEKEEEKAEEEDK